MLARHRQKPHRRLSLSPLLREVAHSDTARVFQLLQTSPQGLSEQEAARRLEQFGNNEVIHEKPPTWWMQLIKACATPFIAVLVVLGTVSLFTDVILVGPPHENWVKVVVLSVMIGVSSLLRFWQEFRTQRAVERLKALVRITATVLRIPSSEQDGRGDMQAVKREVPMAGLVPGDLIHLAAGDLVPADVRLLTSRNLFVSQSVLTGEFMPVEKYDTPGDGMESFASTRRSQRDPFEAATLCFMGTTVVSGTATALVAATGRQTVFGSMTSRMVAQRTITSFDKGVNRVSWLLIRFMLALVPVVFVINGLSRGDWQEAFFFGLAVAVGLTPEMLPLVVTANLARGAMAMAKQKVIVKRLTAIQHLGTMDLLCTDKTGTLTEDRVTLVRHLDAQGADDEHVLHLAYLNSAYQTGSKQSIDRAILEHVEQEHLLPTGPRYHKLDELPFDFVRRRLSVIVQQESEPPLLICKGALEETLQACGTVEHQGRLVPLTEVVRARALRLGAELHEDGLRVVAVAYKHLSYLHTQYALDDEQDLVFAGYIGLLDPPKSTAREAIAALVEHGVAVKILTGDNEVVTARICHEVGLDPSRTVLGREMDGMSEEELADIAEQTTVFARLDPLQKARVICAFKDRGHTVGYLGDGVNDAAALRDADVGISVDTAVAIAKESADLILLEKSLLVLGQGVTEGRIVFGNIIKYLKMTASSNFGNVLSILVASAFLPFLPMLSIQLLVQNLLYDLSQLALPWDRVDREFITRPRTWEAGGLARFMLCIGPISSLFDITTFLLLWFVFRANSPAAQALFQSGWFIEGLLSQTLIVHLIRTQRIPFFQSTASWPVLAVTGSVMVVGVALPFTPFGAFIGLQPLPLGYFPWLMATLVAYCVLTQIIKTWYLKRFKVWL